ncbi:MAG: hypothetical protein GYB49_09610 [Alphaproteobacteria bacterium]|nr:hypothetical protein [Hyphomonas sp.]MBR9807465.1 hypothetical protein [Alphaproteobacteria bacterium]|tara:strand:+ start:35 stop:631 length:597 start_codon:yes stop_codon:yes gene_type:complete
MKYVKTLIIGFAAMLSFSMLSACESFSGLTAVQEREATPRAAALMMQADIEPAVKGMADACEAGLLDTDTTTLIVKYADPIRTAIGAYASSARPCIVIDGKLVTDPEASGTCYRGSVQQASSAVPSVLKEVGLAVGGEIGKRAFLAGVLATSFVTRGDATSVDGFDTETVDYSLKAFDDTWASVQADADRLQACAAAG